MGKFSSFLFEVILYMLLLKLVDDGNTSWDSLFGAAVGLAIVIRGWIYFFQNKPSGGGGKK